jgi:hypothetical protein
MIEVLPIGSRVPCACPRHLITEELRGRITRRPDGRIHFPPAARYVALQVEHRAGCPAAPTEHEHWNVSSDGWIYRCSICGLERTNIEIAAEIRERSELRAIS